MSLQRLDPARHDWMTADSTARVMRALNPLGKPVATRFVGGCVRNALMGRKVDDIDCATRLLPQEVVDRAEAAGLRVVPTGLDHGTVTVIADGQPFEVTTLRRDVETDGRHAEVAFTTDWHADSARRDFRLNAIYADPDGTLFDPQEGIADALAGRVRFIGDPGARIREDYLRSLRFFRFVAHYGDDPIDAAALAAIARELKGLRYLSAERVWKELKRLLGAPNPEASLIAMRETGALEALLPEVLALDLFRSLLKAEAEQQWPPDPLLRLMALVPRFYDVSQRLIRRLKLSNAEADRLTAWTRTSLHPRLLLGKTEAEQHQLLYGHDLNAIHDRTRLAYALDRAADEVEPAQWQQLLDMVAAWTPPSFPLRGADLKDSGIEEGPAIGATLKALEALWVRGGFRAGRDELLAAVPMVRRSR